MYAKDLKKLSINKAAFNTELNLCRAEEMISERLKKYMKHIIEVSVHNQLYHKNYTDLNVIETEVFNNLKKLWLNYSVGNSDGLSYIRRVTDQCIEQSDKLRNKESRKASAFQILSHLPKNVSLVSINPKFRSSEQAIQYLHEDASFDTEEFLSKVGKLLTSCLQSSLIPSRKPNVVTTKKSVKTTVINGVKPKSVTSNVKPKASKKEPSANILAKSKLTEVVKKASTKAKAKINGK